MRPTPKRCALVALWVCGLAGAFLACTQEHREERARAAAAMMKASLPDIDGAAQAQHASPEAVRAAQQALTALHEYQGAITGQLDQVTINAIQAFQRAQGLRDDGVLDSRTRERLAAAAAPPRRD